MAMQEDNDKNKPEPNKIIIKEIKGGDDKKTGQFIVSKSNKNGDIPLFAFSGAPSGGGSLKDSLIVVGATAAGLFSLVLYFLFSNKDIVPYISH